MEELPPSLGANLPELANELYRTGLDCHREGKFMQGIEALERSLATYQQLANNGQQIAVTVLNGRTAQENK